MSSEWADPGIVEVAPGVHRIPLPLPNDGLRAVNVYAITGGSGVVLVDAGWALSESEIRLRTALRTLGRDLVDISRFLVTHIHRDHYTQAIAIRRQFGTQVALGADEKTSLDRLKPDQDPLRAQVEQLREAGAAPLVERVLAWRGSKEHSAENYERPDIWLDDRDELALDDRRLLVIATPGHTRGHVVFAEREAALLFAGDHVLPHITPSIGFEPAPGELPLRDYLRSLAVVRDLPDMRLLPAHGPVIESVHGRIDQLLDHHGARLDACEAAVRAGVDTAYGVARVLTWTRRLRHFDELDLFNELLATTETAAHLNLLAAQGRLTRRRVAGVVHYAVA